MKQTLTPGSQSKNGKPLIHARRKVVLILIALLSVGLCFVWWRHVPPPSVGGGKPDSLLAIWVKSRIYASVSPLDEQGFTRLTPQNAAGWYAIFREPVQSVEYYQSQHPLRPTPARGTIVLQPLGPMTDKERALLNNLKEYCAAFFQLPVRIDEPLPLSAKIETRTRSGRHPGGRTENEKNQYRQYNAGEIIDNVLAPRLPADAAAYLGITMADLWAEDLSFVFGLGSYDKRTGVYSLCRYYPQFKKQKNQPHGKPLPVQDRQRTLAGEKQTLKRACQVLNHEAGHIFGLYHCVLYKCSMNGGNSLSDFDATPLDYCPVCHSKLLWNISFDARKRYEDLLKFYQKHKMTDEARWVEGRILRVRGR